MFDGVKPKNIAISLVRMACFTDLCIYFLPVTADILDRVSPKFHQLGLEYECVGGGRIHHDSKSKKIHIYGYSVVRWSTLYQESDEYCVEGNFKAVSLAVW